MTVSVPRPEELAVPLPRGGAYPPLQLIYMQKDTGKAKEVRALLAGPPAARGGAEVEALVSGPRVVTPLYFTERAGLAANHSQAVRSSLLAAGHLRADGHVASHPQRGNWSAAVREALPRKARTGLPGQNLQAAMDAVFQELDVAYAYHAATCEHIDASLAFFARHLPSKAVQGGATAPSAAGGKTKKASHLHTTHTTTHAKPPPG